MHREPLLRLLAAYVADDPIEERARREIDVFVREQPDCFQRTLTIGHVTGSAWLLNGAGNRVLLTHHRKLDKWLQLGGHADGNPDVLDVALREAREESGIAAIVPVLTVIFDVDVHVIPPYGREPEHRHFDVRFLLQVTGDEPVRVGEESHDLAWVSAGDLPRLRTDESVLRMNRKWLRLLNSPFG